METGKIGQKQIDSGSQPRSIRSDKIESIGHWELEKFDRVQPVLKNTHSGNILKDSLDEVRQIDVYMSGDCELSIGGSAKVNPLLRRCKDTNADQYCAPTKVRGAIECLGATQNFSANISKWEVSNRKNMGGMFQGVRACDVTISKWGVSSVTKMSVMTCGQTERKYVCAAENEGVTKCPSAATSVGAAKCPSAVT